MQLYCMCVGWSEASLQNWWLHRKVSSHFGEKDAQVFEHHVCWWSRPKIHVYDSRYIFVFKI